MKKSGMEHIAKKYPSLLGPFDIAGLNSRRDAGLRRILRKHMERRAHLVRKQTSSRPRRVEKRVFCGSVKLFTCPVCRGVLVAPVTLGCGHTFCKDCLPTTNNGRCFECESEVQCAQNTNILVQDIVDKWRTLKEERGVPKAEDRLPSPEPRYCLRSRCNGLHGNSFDEANIKIRKTASPFEDVVGHGAWDRIPSSDLECILCSQCLLAPVTTTCGHTFCRECLARVLDHGLACPLCMAPLKTTEQYRGETVVLTQALRLLAFEEHQDRLSILQQEIENLERSNEIPIFICTNAFPKVACPLFVYEPRYRLLSRRCLQSSRKRFGMAAKSANGDKFALYGTLLEIRDCVNLQDGTSILTTIGLRRFKVLSRGEQDGYDTAIVQYIRDVTVSAEKLNGLMCLHQTVYNKTVRWLETLKSKLLAEIERCIGCMPDVEENWFSLPDGPAWTWWLIAVLPLSIQLRVGFLSSTSLEKRLLAIDKMLDHLKIRMKAVEKSALTCAPREEAAETCSYSDRSADISYHNTD